LESIAEREGWTAADMRALLDDVRRSRRLAFHRRAAQD
jgi:hypothetical protein